MSLALPPLLAIPSSYSLSLSLFLSRSLFDFCKLCFQCFDIPCSKSNVNMRYNVMWEAFETLIIVLRHFTAKTRRDINTHLHLSRPKIQWDAFDNTRKKNIIVTHRIPRNRRHLSHHVVATIIFSFIHCFSLILLLWYCFNDQTNEFSLFLDVWRVWIYVFWLLCANSLSFFFRKKPVFDTPT